MGIPNKDPDSLTLLGHLDELRSRIIYCLICVLAITLLALNFTKPLIDLLKFPALKSIPGFVLLKPTEIVSVYVKVALGAAIIVSSPVIFYNLWKFISPVIRKDLRPAIIRWVISSCVLFLAGIFFMYKIAVPYGLNFLLKMTEGVASPMISLNSYISMVLSLMFCGGLVFEIPVISGLLTSAGMITPYLMRSKRKEAIFVLFIAAAILTPTTDIFNMLLFAAPMVILYEASIVVSSFIYKARLKNKAEEIYAIENQ